MNWTLLIEDLQLAIMLGALSSGIFAKIREQFFPEVTGRRLTIFALIGTAAISGVIGYFYTGIAPAELIRAIIWGVVGAQGVYALVNEVRQTETEVELIVVEQPEEE